MYASLPSRRIAVKYSMPCYHGTASSSSLCHHQVRRLDVLDPEERRVLHVDAAALFHGGTPMRLCVFSYWNARDMPVPQRMPP